MQTFKKVTCPKCGCGVFYIFRRDKCDDCPHNGAYDEDEEDYIYDEATIKEKGLTRDEAFDNGTCAYGTSHDNGCEIYKCATCGHEDHLPYCDAC